MGQLKHHYHCKHKQHGHCQGTSDDEWCASQSGDWNSVRAMIEPNPGKSHQLPCANLKRRKGCRQLYFFDQQTVKQTENQDLKDSENELAQPELKSEP